MSQEQLHCLDECFGSGCKAGDRRDALGNAGEDSSHCCLIRTVLHQFLGDQLGRLFELVGIR